MFDSNGTHEGEETMTTITAPPKQRRPRLDARLEAFIRLHRRYAAAAAAPMVIPEALLEHGFVSLSRAAKLLNTTVDDLANREGRYRVRGHRLPILKSDRTVPISELCREFKRRHDDRIQRLAAQAAEVLNDVRCGVARGVCWNASPSVFSGIFEDGPDGLSGYDFEGVAEQLAVSKAEAKRLMNSVLFCWSTRHNGTIVTQEELDAYKRKVERSAPGLLAAHLRTSKASPPMMMPRTTQGKAVAK